MPNDQSRDKSDQDSLLLAERLRIVIGKLVRSVRSSAQTPTTAQSETLGLLDRGGPLSVAELASRRSVRHQSMRLVVGQLIEGGLVEKLQNPADGRSQLIALTQQGRQAQFLSRRARADAIGQLIQDRLSAEERQTLQAAITILERLA